MTEHIERPPYTDLGSSYGNHLSQIMIPPGFDLVQPKYDGIWVDVYCNGTDAIAYSRDGGDEKARWPCEALSDTWLHGEYLFGQQWAFDAGLEGQLVLFDLTQLGKLDFRSSSYTMRRDTLIKVLDRHDAPPEWSVVEQFSSVQWKRVWKWFVEKGGFEGLVFRDSTSMWEAPVGRIKKLFTMDYVMMGVVEGGGKNKGRLGAIVAGLYDDGELVEICRVGGGFTDQTRAEIWEDRYPLMGRVFEAGGAKVFKSGALRHPQFLRWREDKSPEQCRREQA